MVPNFERDERMDLRMFAFESCKLISKFYTTWGTLLKNFLH